MRKTIESLIDSRVLTAICSIQFNGFYEGFNLQCSDEVAKANGISRRFRKETGHNPTQRQQEHEPGKHPEYRPQYPHVRIDVKASIKSRSCMLA